MPKTDYKLHLKGYVGGWDFDADYIDYVLGNNKDQTVNVLIDSTGGSLASALSIAHAFKNHGDIHVHFCGFNASAATIASLGAKHITMESSAMYLVHKCSFTFENWKEMNAEQIAQYIQELEADKKLIEKMDLNVAEMYAKKCKKTKEELLALMTEGGWLTAKEAKEWGFVDEVEEDGEEATPIPEALKADLIAANIPLPNIPNAQMKEKSVIDRLAETIKAYFTTSNTTNQHKEKIEMEKFNYPTMQAQAQDVKASEDGGVNLTQAQAKRIEDALANNEAQIKALTEQVEALKKNPAGVTAQVVDDKKGTQQSSEKNEVEAFAETFVAAQKLFNSIH